MNKKSYMGNLINSIINQAKVIKDFSGVDILSNPEGEKENNNDFYDPKESIKNSQDNKVPRNDKVDDNNEHTYSFDYDKFKTEIEDKLSDNWEIKSYHKEVNKDDKGVEYKLSGKIKKIDENDC